ncbi:hypothetical protein IHI24_000773 [Rickettsia endosymbiont of Cardiosporidium cionae]|nr:hypothetical protein IHI24_000773 [Rickettsia endosymbiont of Cardiosporidium cionae]
MPLLVNLQSNLTKDTDSEILQIKIIGKNISKKQKQSKGTKTYFRF